MEGNLESIREALRQSDLVIFSLHCHQGRENKVDKPATFVEEFARACIDEGAHLFLGHGSHVLMGIELRNGKPIFYSLGNFIVYLGQNKHRSQRGRPLLAKDALAEKILKEVQTLSLEYGTEIVIKDGIGEVVL